MQRLCLLMILVFAPKAFAQSGDFFPYGCDPSPTPVVTPVSVNENQTVMATICRQGEDVLIMTSNAIPKSNLIYFGINAGLPFFGYEFTYSRLRNGALHYHLSLAAEGSLGGNATTLRAGFHPIGNAFFTGGKVSVMNNMQGKNEFLLGPSIGFSGGRRFIAGHIGISLLADYNPEYRVVHAVPELVAGIRLRLFRFGK